MGEITASVAEKTILAAPQRVASRNPHLVESLAANELLADDVFTTIYRDRKVPVALAKKLLGANALTDAQFDHVLNIERRGTVLNVLFENGAPTQERLTQYAQSKALTQVTADKIVSTMPAYLTTDWLRLVAGKVQGRALLELWLRDPAGFADADIIEGLRTIKTWGPAHADLERITWLLATRPGVLAGAAHSDELRVRTAAAGCRHLLDRDLQLAAASLDDATMSSAWVDAHVYQLLALANNPVVSNDVVTLCDRYLALAEPEFTGSGQARIARHPDPVTKPYEEEDDPRKLGWLLNRTLPFDGRDGRWHDLDAVLRNPHLGVGEVRTIASKMKDALLPDRLLPAYNALVDRFPDEQNSWFARQEPCDPEQPTFRNRSEAPLTARQGEYVDARVAEAANHPVGSLVCNLPPLIYLERELGENEAAWVFALDTAEGGFTGTIGELAMVTQAALGL